MRLIINSPVEHDGKLLAAGDKADLKAEAARALIAAGVAVDAAAAERAEGERLTAEEAAARAEAERLASEEAASKAAGGNA